MPPVFAGRDQVILPDREFQELPGPRLGPVLADLPPAMVLLATEAPPL